MLHGQVGRVAVRQGSSARHGMSDWGAAGLAGAGQGGEVEYGGVGPSRVW